VKSEGIVRKQLAGEEKGSAQIYSRKSAVILPEKRCYILGRVRLYCRKISVILPEDLGYIHGRKRLYLAMHFARTSLRPKTLEQTNEMNE
jgi:hypothetical protein